MTPSPTRGYKAKTITKILTAKYASWIKSIDDATVRKLAQDNTIITGGAIASMLLGEEPNDFDVYLKTPEAAFAIAQYYVAKLKANPPKAFASIKDKIQAIMEEPVAEGAEVVRTGNLLTKGPQPARVRVVMGKTEKALRGEDVADAHGDYTVADGEITDPTEPASYVGNTEALDGHSAESVADKEDAQKRGKYRLLFITANAITLSDQIQIVLRFTGSVDEIHTNYDFTHCTNAFTSWDRQIILRAEALECLLSRELRYQGSRYPIASVIRTRKFLTRGWTINAGQYVKMAYQIAALDLNDPAVLEDQLVGVDSAYFSMLIATLNKELGEKLEKDPQAARQIDGNRLITLIDKIF